MSQRGGLGPPRTVSLDLAAAPPRPACTGRGAERGAPRAAAARTPCTGRDPCTGNDQAGVRRRPDRGRHGEIRRRRAGAGGWGTRQAKTTFRQIGIWFTAVQGGPKDGAGCAAGGAPAAPAGGKVDGARRPGRATARYAPGDEHPAIPGSRPERGRNHAESAVVPVSPAQPGVHAHCSAEAAGFLPDRYAAPQFRRPAAWARRGGARLMARRPESVLRRGWLSASGAGLLLPGRRQAAAQGRHR